MTFLSENGTCRTARLDGPTVAEPLGSRRRPLGFRSPQQTTGLVEEPVAGLQEPVMNRRTHALSRLALLHGYMVLHGYSN